MFQTIRGVKFRKKSFAKMSFDVFKATYEKQVPWKKIDPRFREIALKDDYEELTGNKVTEKKKKSYISDTEKTE